MATRRRTVKSGHGATLIHEQLLSIRERDAGLLCQRDADTNVTDAAARVRQE